MKFVLISTLSLALASCALSPGRSMLTDDEGDQQEELETGVSELSEEGIGRGTARLHSSEAAQTRSREELALERELAYLERKQSDGAYRHYEEYRERLGSVSERIYYLKLPTRTEREEYLAAKGIMQRDTVYQRGARMARQRRQLVLGMSKKDVQFSWGRPERVDFAGNPNEQNERWLYRRDGAVKYIYFEAGLVGGWTDNSRERTN